MLGITIKYSIIVICSLLVYSRMISSAANLKTFLFFVPFALLLGCLIGLTKNSLYPFHVFAMVMFFSLVLSQYLKVGFLKSLIASTLSFGFSYAAFILVCAIPIGMIAVKCPELNDRIKTILLLFIGIAQLILTLFLFSSTRIRSGFRYIINSGKRTVGIHISLILLIIESFLSMTSDAKAVYSIPLIALIMTSILLLIWQRNQVTKIYQERAITKQLDAMTSALDSSFNSIRTLREDNDRLSAIIHKDNKLIPAMELAVKSCISEKASEEVMVSLCHLIQERSDAIECYEKHFKRIPETGSIIINAMLQYLQKRSKDEGITFNVSETVSQLSELITDPSVERDLNTIIADLIENAIVAIRNIEQKNIMIEVEQTHDFFCFNVYDSGNPFAPSVLQSLGYRRTTTHKESGGTGIGLMSTLELIGKYQASFELDEYPSDEYTKCVKICFDGLSQYRIVSPRYRELIRSVTRPDVCIAEHRNQMKAFFD